MNTMIADMFYEGAEKMWPTLTPLEFGQVARDTVKSMGPDERWSLQRMNDELVKQLTLKKGEPSVRL